MKYKSLAQKGFIAISTVLIVSVIVLVISISTTMLSIGSAQSSLAVMKGEDALGFVEGCVEDGLLKAQASADYNGGTVASPEGTCQITVSKNNTVWTMTVMSTGSEYVKSTQIVFDRTPSKIVLLSQKEI